LNALGNPLVDLGCWPTHGPAAQPHRAREFWRVAIEHLINRGFFKPDTCHHGGQAQQGLGGGAGRLVCTFMSFLALKTLKMERSVVKTPFANSTRGFTT
jgi:hypothetical protein